MTIDGIVLSHVHSDHTGGLDALLTFGIKPTVYVPALFPAGFKDGVRARTELAEVTDPMTIGPGIHTTGEMGSDIGEQALVVDTADGTVVITGCAHPGIEPMVVRAGKHARGGIALVIGGFHLGDASRARIEGIIAGFREMAVGRVAPCHCTGDRARGLLADAFRDDCALAGVVWSKKLGSPVGG